MWYMVSERGHPRIVAPASPETVSPVCSGLLSQGWRSPGQAQNGLCYLAPRTFEHVLSLEAPISKPPCRALSASPS